MWKSPQIVEQELRQKVEKYANANNLQNYAIRVFSGIEHDEMSRIQHAVQEARQQGASTVLVGVGVMPSHLVEPAAKLADHLLILSVPRLFQRVGQYYESP